MIFLLFFNLMFYFAAKTIKSLAELEYPQKMLLCNQCFLLDSRQLLACVPSQSKTHLIHSK